MTYPIQDLQFLTTVKDSEVWKTVASVIATITDEAQFQADRTGIAFRSKDQTREAFLDIYIPSDTFQYYHCPGLLRFGILADDFLKVVKRFDSNMPVELFIHQSFLAITSKSTTDRNYTLNLIESKPLVSPLKTITFESKLVIKTDILKSILEDIKVLSTNITLKTIHRNATTTTTFDSENDTGLALVTIGQIHDDPNILLHRSVREKTAGRYSISPISQLLNLIGTYSEFVELEYSHEGPLRLKTLLFDRLSFQLYVAPQLK